MTVQQLPFGIPGQIFVASLATVIVLFSAYNSPILQNEAVQVLGLTLASIVAVAIVAGILICIPDFLNGRHKRYHRRSRGRSRGRTRQSEHNNHRRQSSRSRERLNQNVNPSSSSNTVKSSSSCSTSSSSRRKTPSMPPLSSRPGSSGNVNFKNIPGRVPINKNSRNNSVRRYSSPPSLPSPEAQSQFSLNPIVERKLEDLMDFDDYWWRELDSRTQYYALILGYTQVTWDDDFDIEELPCEDWDWDEMTKEQKAAAQHFGYTEETWSD